MNKVLLTILPLCFNLLSASSQYITSKGTYLEGTKYISTSRIDAFHTNSRFAKPCSISMDYILLAESPGHRLGSGEFFTIQINFFERNIGQAVLLKCKNGKVIELKSNSIQRDPFVQIYWIREDVAKSIIEGGIQKIRILTQNGFIDRDIKNNLFSTAVSKCYNLLIEEKIKDMNNAEKFKNFRNNF